jgi:hypothetical protein
MTFIAAAVPSTEPWRDHDLQVLAEAENVIVGVLFDDIVRTLVRPSTAPVAEPAGAATPGLERTEPAPATVGRRHSHPGWARSPPGDEHSQSVKRCQGCLAPLHFFLRATANHLGTV